MQDAQAKLGWVGPIEATLPIIDASQEALEKRLKVNLPYGEYLQLYQHYRDMKGLYDTERQQIDQMVTTQTVIYWQSLGLATLKRKLADVYLQTAEVLVPTQPSFFERYKTLFRAVGIFLVMIAAGYATKLAVWLVELTTTRVKALWPTSTFSVKRITTLASFTASICRLFIWIFGVITILYEFGINPATSSGAIGLVGLIMAGMFQQIVVDFIKGLDIVAGRHYSVGDFVEVDKKFGHVIDFSVKYTRIRTLSGQELNIPNSQCIPSRRFPEGYVDNYVDIVLQEKTDVTEAREVINRVCMYMNRRLEPIKERPQFIDRFRTAGGRAVLRYRVRVLPGCDWVLTDYFIPSVKSALQAKNIGLDGDPKYFFINRIETFRKLFSRQLTEQEILQEAAEMDLPAADHQAGSDEGHQHAALDGKPPIPPESHGVSDKPPPPPEGSAHTDKPVVPHEFVGRSE
jgi:small-conductance mechanosensitive channel